MPHDLAFTSDGEGRMVVVYHPNDPNARALLARLGTLTDQRAGFVWPETPVLRCVFRGLRKAFGGAGRVAQWTRGWRCRWVVVDAETSEQLPGTYPTHDAAVEAEVQWSLAHGFPKHIIGK